MKVRVNAAGNLLCGDDFIEITQLCDKAKEFIKDGNKVKVVLTMKGRELTRREESKTCLYKFITYMEDVAIPENMPRDENNRSMVILKRKQ